MQVNLISDLELSISLMNLSILVVLALDMILETFVKMLYIQLYLSYRKK